MSKRWRPTAFSLVKGLKTFVNHYNPSSLDVQSFSLIVKYQPLSISWLIQRVFISLPLNIRRGGSASPAVLMHLIFDIRYPLLLPSDDLLLLCLIEVYKHFYRLLFASTKSRLIYILYV